MYSSMSEFLEELLEELKEDWGQSPSLPVEAAKGYLTRAIEEAWLWEDRR